MAYLKNTESATRIVDAFKKLLSTTAPLPSACKQALTALHIPFYQSRDLALFYKGDFSNSFLFTEFQSFQKHLH